MRVDRKDAIRATVKGQVFEHRLGELLEGARSHFMEGCLSEAVSFHRVAVKRGYLTETMIANQTQEKETDYYYLRARQKNNQWAWSSPIWVKG